MYLLLGSNIGDRLVWLEFAFNGITDSIGKIIKASPVYETAPWGELDQEKFYNQALMVETWHAPAFILKAINTIEDAAGRVRSGLWEPRTLDIDILMYDDLMMDTERLTIPHPRLHKRRFVLVPLADIAGQIMHPKLRKKIRDLLRECPDQSEVSILP